MAKPIPTDDGKERHRTEEKRIRKAGTTGYRHRVARRIISALATTAAVSMLPIMGMPMQASADEDDTACSKEDNGVYYLSSENLYAQWDWTKKVHVRYHDTSGQATGMPGNAEQHPGDHYTIPSQAPPVPDTDSRDGPTRRTGDPTISQETRSPSAATSMQ